MREITKKEITTYIQTNEWTARKRERERQKDSQMNEWTDRQKMEG